MRLKILNTTSSIFIILSAVCLGFEANLASHTKLQPIFLALDSLFVAYFTLELILRIKYRQTSYKDFKISLLNHLRLLIGKQTVVTCKNESIEEWSWLIFDFILVLLTYISFLKHIVDHPQLILLCRLFRVFRILRLFELNNTLRNIEKKIISAIPIIFTFLILINIILYTYALIGMYMYEFNKFNSIDFSSVYNAMISLFMIMTNGWSDPIKEMRAFENIPSFVTDAYIISFFIFSVLITLNVFLAVMTSQIQERIKYDMDLIKKKEDQIQEELHSFEKDVLIERDYINRKLDQILNKVSQSPK